MSLFRRTSQAERAVGDDRGPAAKRTRALPAGPRPQPSEVNQEYKSSLAVIAQRYPDAEPKHILAKLIVDDVDYDCVEKNGVLLACYLFSIKDHEKLADGVEVWLRSQLSKYRDFPVSYACLQHAVDFLPALQQAMSYRSFELPDGFEDHINLALPVRRAGVAQTAQSRTDIRGMCMESLVASRNFMAQMEASAAAAGAPTFVSAKPSGTRGRILGVGQLSGAGRHVQAKINTGMYRESEDDPDEEPDDAYDLFIRFDGRQQEEQPAMLGGSRPGYQYDPPTEGADLIGYKIRATFPTGPQRELRWHDGYVIDYRNNAINYDYLFFYEIDENSEWIQAAHQVELLKGLGIKNLVNCTELRNFHPNDFAHHSCPVADSPQEDIGAHFDDVVKWVRSRYGAVLIYCVKGISRSASVMLAVLMHMNGLDLWSAWSLLKQKRPKVRPNPGFCQQLESYEKRIRGSSSVVIMQDGFHSRSEQPALKIGADTVSADTPASAAPKSKEGKAGAKEGKGRKTRAKGSRSSFYGTDVGSSRASGKYYTW